jgi:signal transduction histidine kinase
LIRNLAFLSQLSSDQGALALREKATNVVIPALVIEAAMYYQEAGEGLGIGINLADRKTQYVVKGHADLLRQVFINVFDNGVKYSDQDTKITVTPHAQSHTGHLLVDIESTGVGFPFEERERIFERGYRGSAAQEIKASGTGLGLYICRRILEVAHNATIEAEYSPKTRKTLFRIRFREFEIGEPYGEGRDESFSTDC